MLMYNPIFASFSAFYDMASYGIECTILFFASFSAFYDMASYGIELLLPLFCTLQSK